MNSKQTIAILGGGYAGMAAAATLAQHGLAVTVLESARQLGGRARGFSHHGLQLDNGQHLLLGCYRQTLRLIELVGGEVARDFVRLPLQLELHGQFSLKAPNLPAPLHLLLAFAQARGLSWGERLRAGRFMLRLRLAGFRVAALPGGQADCTVADLLAAYGQDGALTVKLWEPLCIAALNTPIAEASAQVLLTVLRDALTQRRADSDMLLPRLDFTALFPQRAAEYVTQRGGTVRLSCGARAIARTTDGFAVTHAQGVETFDQVICATSPSVAARLLAPLMDTSAITALPQQPIYTVYLRYPPTIRLPAPMLGLHQCLSQWLFDHGQISGRAGLLVSVISAEGRHQDLAQDALAEAVVVELQREFGITAQPDWYKVIAEKRATFSCRAGLQRPPQESGVPGLWLAGDYTAGDYPATLEGAVLSGLRCAELALENVLPT